MRFTRPLQVAAACVALLMTGGCGGDGDEANSPEASTSAAGSTSPSPSPVTEVSAKTACELLFDSAGAPMEPLVDFVAGGPDAPGITETEGTLAELRQIAERAPEEMRPNLTVLADEVQAIIDTGSSQDMTAFKAAGIEISNQCEDAL